MGILTSGARFTVTYLIRGTQTEAAARARDIAVEDTTELSADLIESAAIRDEVIGRVEDLRPAGGNIFAARVSFAIETAASELTQFLSVVFGNISLKPGIRVVGLELPDEMLNLFAGPRFGREGLRAILGAASRPLLCTAIKPMGLSARECADLARRFALGGIDIIKDDHGLTNQPFAPFEERVALCVRAVREANRETGGRSIYMANVTASFDEVFRRARFAKEAGAGGLLIAPGLTGYDVMRRLASDDGIALPVMCHPSFQGSFVASPESGIAHGILFGLFARLAGADAAIFPNFGGRFGFTRGDCAGIARETAAPMGNIKPIFPAPGGGMSLDRIRDMSELYGNQVIYLIGADLFRHGGDIIEVCRRFRRMAEE